MKAIHIHNRIFRFILILVMFISSGAPALAQNPDSNPAQEGSPGQPVVAQVYYNGTDDLNQLASYLDIWEVNHEQGYLVAMLKPELYASLQQAGYRVVIDQAKTDLLSQPLIPLPGQGTDSIPGYPCYRTVEETFTSMQDIVTNHPGMAELIDIGDSWDKFTGGGPVGYDMLALRLTNESFGVIDNKPTFFVMAEIHARELVTAETAIRYAEYLINNYGIDPNVTWLLDYFRVYIVTMSNPDGRKFAETGEWWRKNTDNDDGCTTYPDYGTDLNRNHSFKWNMGGSSGQPCAETYHGPSAGSEPEVQAIEQFVLTLFPDQRGPGDNDPAPVGTTGTFITLHAYGELVLWPWGWTSGQAPNNTQLQTLGRHLAYFNNHTPQQSWDLYQTSGTSEEFAYGTLGIAGYTFEMGSTFFQDCSSFENTIYPTNRDALLYAFRTARRPYMNPAGPDSLNLIVTPDTVPAGTPVQLTATANDTRFNNSHGTEPTQNINEARYSIDDPSWITGTVTYPMTASDGNFNNPIENIQATVDTGGLSAGRHSIFVESKDANGNWGVASAVFLNVTTPQYGVMLTPATASGHADPGQSITYHMQINNIGQTSDSYDISVVSNWAYSAPTTIGPIAAGGNASFDVQVTVPSDANNGESDTATVTVESQASPGVTDASSLTTIANLYDLSLTPSTAQAQGYPGEQVDYILQLTNLGNITDTFDIQSTSLWTVTVPGSVGPLAAGDNTDVHVLVDIPPSAQPNDRDTANITATSQGDGSKTQASTLTTTAIQTGPFVTPASDAANGDPGQQIVYSLLLTSYNFVPDTFNLSVDAVWATDFPSVVGPILPDQSETVLITVTIPSDASGGASDTATVTFASSIPGIPSATATLVTTANSIYDLQAVPVTDTLTAHSRGTTVEYTVFVTNTGNTTDTINIYVLSSDWSVDVPVNVGPLGRGESTVVVITVTVPLDISMGDSNLATIAFISQGNPMLGRQVLLTTNTFWYSTYLPLSQKQ